MKYIVMMFGDQATMAEMRSRRMDRRDDLVHDEGQRRSRRAGEFVAAEGLADASQAKTVRIRGRGRRSRPTARSPSRRSRSPATGSSTSRTRQRALDFASHIVAFTGGPTEVRQVMDGPPEEYLR